MWWRMVQGLTLYRKERLSAGMMIRSSKVVKGSSILVLT